MARITIFTTNHEASQFDTFTNGDDNFVFVLMGCDGPRQLIEGPAWVFVDWVLKDCSGLELVRRLRLDSRVNGAHITLLLDCDDDDSRRRALAAGVDDYALAPLDRKAMLDRVLALYSNTRAPVAEHMIELGDLSINLGSELARWQGVPVILRPNEFRLLRFLAENPNRVYSRAELIAALGKAFNLDNQRTVDAWIKRLRNGLSAVGARTILRTVHGKGYVLDLW